MTTHTYVSANSPSLTLYFDIDEDRLHEKVQFKSANFITDDEAIAAVLDKAIAKKPALGRAIRKLDKAAAEETARRHLAAMKSPLPAGVSGGMNSENANLANRMQMNERDAVIDKIDPKVKAEQLPEKDLLLTVAGNNSGLPPATKADAKIEIAPKQQIVLNQK